jgi:DNA-binding LacI/PurR family transcriptional regulator
MAVRLKDVAARAGVSIKTASNVINDYPHIRPLTRAKVQAAIDELHYRPNLSARGLKHGKAGFLALALPQLDEPYFAELAAIVSARAAELGYILLLDATEGRDEAERLVLEGMRSHVIDGVIFSPLALSAKHIAARRDELPMVLLGERAVPSGYDHVAVDSVASAAAMTSHLLGLGRRRVAAIGRESAQGTASVRLRGYQKALRQAGVAYRPELVIGVPSYTREDGRRGMQQLLALPEPPDAVFCFNDLMAIGAMRACHDQGVSIPDDIAVAGFDDIAETRYSNPTVTTISPDLDLLSREVLRLVISRIEGRTVAESVKVPWTLQVRESTVGRQVAGTPAAERLVAVSSDR